MTFPKPEKPAPAPRRRIAASPACACGDAFLRHFRRGSILPANCQRKGCDCDGYQRPARSSVSTAPKCVLCDKREAQHAEPGRVDNGACGSYTPPRSSVLRSPVVRKKAKAPDLGCRCGHAERDHVRVHTGQHLFRAGCMACGLTKNLTPKCGEFLARKSAPARTKRKLMPKCKHCAEGHGRHLKGTNPAYCPGYEPALGIRQKRRTPAAAIKRRCDELWSKIVKAGGVCELQAQWPHECKGPLEAMHMIPRTFAATRWLPIDGVAGCSGAHLYWTRRPEAWSAHCLELWGYEVFKELWAKARAMQPVDMEATYAALSAEAARRGIA